MKLKVKAEDDESVDKKMYQSAVGSLLCLMTMQNSPRHAFAVNSVARFSSNPIPNSTR